MGFAPRGPQADLVEEINRLKSEPGKDLVAWGGAAFAQSLARADVVDEYRFTFHPVAVGDRGLRVFADLPKPLPMELVDEQTFTSASVRIFRRLDWALPSNGCV
jgi:dihydrofolate reductase